jgi:hypothetical protein
MTAGDSSSQVSEQLKQAVVEHYERQLDRHGPTAQGMDWKDEASQRLRFEVLCGICDLGDKTLCEIGCGVGHLYDWLRERRLDVEYCGIDLSEQMIEVACQRHPSVHFERRDILRDSNLPMYDVVVCSGLFHVKLAHDDRQWLDFVELGIRRMYSMCRVGVAFNLITDQVDFRSENLFYSNPGEMLDFCRRELTRFAAVRHDYPLYEYTVYLYREPRPE